MLANANFVEKAAERVVDAERSKLQELEQALAALGWC
ncbi:MAG: hypothetical protein ACRD01_05725 [Terriglobales bacterium]